MPTIPQQYHRYDELSALYDIVNSKLTQSTYILLARLITKLLSLMIFKKDEEDADNRTKIGTVQNEEERQR